MHILFIVYEDNPASGGSFRVAESLIDGVEKAGYSCTVCFIYGGRGLIGRKRPNNCLYLKASPGRGYRSVFKFINFIRSARPAVVHFIDPAYWVQILFMFYRQKSVLHVHGAFWSRPDSVRLKILWWISRRSIDRFVAITHGVKDNLVYNGFVSASRIDVVYNSVYIKSATDIGLDSNYKIKNIHLSSKCKIIGSVGRVVGGRGFDDLIRLLQFLNSSWCALIVGDGPYLNDLKCLANDLNLSDRVFFVGQVDDVKPYYQVMDIYGFFARYESFGLALADAMLYKKHVFGLKGAGEYYDSRYPLVTEENSTFVLRPNCNDQWRKESDETLIKLADKINDYQIRPERYDEKCKNAYDHVSSLFNLQMQISKMAEVYAKL